MHGSYVNCTSGSCSVPPVLSALGVGDCGFKSHFLDNRTLGVEEPPATLVRDLEALAYLLG